MVGLDGGVGDGCGGMEGREVQEGEDKRGEQPHFTFTCIASDSFIRILEGELEKGKKG